MLVLSQLLLAIEPGLWAGAGAVVGAAIAAGILWLYHRRSPAATLAAFDRLARGARNPTWVVRRDGRILGRNPAAQRLRQRMGIVQDVSIKKLFPVRGELGTLLKSLAGDADSFEVPAHLDAPDDRLSTLLSGHRLSPDLWLVTLASVLSRMSPALTEGGEGDAFLVHGLLRRWEMASFETNADNEIVFVGNRFAQLLGFAPTVLEGRRFEELLAPSFRLRETLVPDQPTEVAVSSAWGDRIWLRLEGTSIRRREDSAADILWLCSDISEKKAAEELQRRLELGLRVVASEWRGTVDALDFPLLILDHSERVVRLNHQAAGLAGLTAKECLGIPVGQLGRGEPWVSIPALFRAFRDTGEPQRVEVVDNRGGTTWELSLQAVAPQAITNDQVLLLMRDVSELVRLQEDLRRRELTGALGDLVAGVAHEVRNPLFALTATLDAFEAECQDAELTEFFQVLRAETGRLQRLMQSLLDYGKPSSAALEAGSVEPVLEEARDACARLAAERQVAVHLDCEPDLPPVRLDGDRLRRAVQNLIDNAVYHSPPGSAVTARAFNTEGCVVVEVLDSGRGFDLALLDRLFQPFFSRRHQGSGLGLGIVQRIVDDHGGTIELDNHPQGGGRARIILPVVSSPLVTAPRRAS